MKILFIFTVLLTSLVHVEPAQAGPIYVYTEPDGSVRFTTKKPGSHIEAKVYKGGSNYSTYKSSRVRYSLSPSHYSYSRSLKLHKDKYNGIIENASIRYGLSKALIKAVIHAESAFNPRAVSHKGAKGLMQLMPSNLKKYGVSNPYSPQQNINAGTKMLSELLKKYSGNLKLALAAYNAGEGAVMKYKGVPPYKETLNYVKKVMYLKRYYG